MTKIHWSKKCDASFLPRIHDKRITIISILFQSFKSLHLEGVGFDIGFPYHHPSIIVKKLINSLLLCNHYRVTLTWVSLKWYNWFNTGSWYMATFFPSKLRIFLLSWSILWFIHSITSRYGKTRVLDAIWCSPDLKIFL